MFNFHKKKFNTVDPLTKVNYYIGRLDEEINKENISEELKTELIKYKKSFECHRDILVKGFDSLHFLGFLQQIYTIVICALYILALDVYRQIFQKLSEAFLQVIVART